MHSPLCEHKLAYFFETIQALGVPNRSLTFIGRKNRVNSKNASAQSANIPIWSIASESIMSTKCAAFMCSGVARPPAASEA